MPALEHPVDLNDQWGFGHGAWSVAINMFPEANAYDELKFFNEDAVADSFTMTSFQVG